MRSLKRILALALCLCALLPAACAAAEGNEELLKTFVLRYGDRESKKIAITMDDMNQREWAWKTVELCKQYGSTMTFFPVGENLKEEDRENWQKLLDTGCEIGNHTTYHESLPRKTAGQIVYTLVMFHQLLDPALGSH